MKKILALFLSLTSLVSSTEASQYCYDVNLSTLYIRGQLEDGDAKKVKSAIDRYNPRNLQITSTGGSAIDGFKIGEYVFKKKINTIASNYCLSACAFIWLAGADRYVDNSISTTVGVHSPYDSRTDKVDNYARKITYEYLFNINIKKIIAMEILTYQGRDSLLVLDPDKMKEWGLEWKKTQKKTKKCV